MTVTPTSALDIITIGVVSLWHVAAPGLSHRRMTYSRFNLRREGSLSQSRCDWGRQGLKLFSKTSVLSKSWLYYKFSLCDPHKQILSLAYTFLSALKTFFCLLSLDTPFDVDCSWAAYDIHLDWQRKWILQGPQVVVSVLGTSRTLFCVITSCIPTMPPLTYSEAK